MLKTGARMISLLKKLLSRKNDAPDSSLPQTHAEAMSLAERMAYRREMLYQAIRESLQELRVVNSMYKFKVVNEDARHHRFIAMIEVTNSFEAKINGMSAGFSQVEAFIRKRTRERIDVSLDAIFWRVNEVESAFVRTRRAGDRSQATLPAANPAQQRQVPGGDPAARRRLARAQPSPSQSEAIAVQHLDYESEHAPLDPMEPTGKTEYGQL